MRRFTFSVRFLASLLAFVFLFSGAGCSGKKVDDNDPASILADAESDISADHYSVALEKLRMIKTRFPYSAVAISATLRIADVYFLQESFAEAAASYELFRDLYPKHEKVAYAMLRVGKSHLKDMPSTVSRDLSAGYRAQEAYEAFLRRFPQAEESTEARKDLEQVRNMLGDKELAIGKYYDRLGYKYSARPRLKKAIANFPETAAAKEAQTILERIGSEAAPGEKPSPDQPLDRW